MEPILHSLPMPYSEFLLRMGCAALCGLAIGTERQLRQRAAGLRTYTLVSIGSALFVSVASMLTGENAPSQIASNVVSGVGFLGAGAMMRSGLTVRGINTAASIWCSAAVGVLAGYGFDKECVTGTLFILAVNVLLRPLVTLINRQPLDPAEQEIQYLLKVSFRGRHESHLRSLLVQLIGLSSLILHEVETVKGETENSSELKATFTAAERQDAQMEQLASRLSMEAGTVGVSWQLLPHARI